VAQGDINDPLTNIPSVVVVDQSAASAAPGEGYAKLEVVDGVLGVRVGTGEWAAVAGGLDGPTLHALTEKATPVDADELLLADSEDSWAAKRATRGTVKGAEAGGLFDAYAQYSFQTTHPDWGGTATSGQWRTVPLNTEDFDPQSIGALASSEVTLAAGTYHFHARQTFFNTQATSLRLYNVTGAVGLGSEGGGYAYDATSVGVVHVDGRFTLAEESVIRLEYWVQATKADTGLGFARTSEGTTQWGVLTLWREA